METEKQEAPKKVPKVKVDKVTPTPPTINDSPFDEPMDDDGKKIPMASPVKTEEEFLQKQKYDRFAGGKKGVTIVIDGKALRKKRAADIGLSELILPPWTKNVTAKYRLLALGAINPATKEPVHGKDAMFPGTYTLYDKFESDPFQKTKLMEYFHRTKVVKDQFGNEKREKEIIPIEFEHSMKVIDVNRDYRGYVFMELHPLNKSNPHRPHDLEPKFERIDVRTYKSDASIAAEMDLAMMAEKIVVEMKDKDKIFGMSIAAGKYQNGLDVGATKNILRQFARTDPRKFFKLNNNPRPAMKLNILDAMTLGIIEYREERRQFIMSESDEVLFTHLIGKDAVDEFVNELALPDNAQSYEALAKLVDYWE